MKAIVLVVLCFFRGILSAPFQDVNHRWELVPDSHGQMNLVDIENYEEPLAPLFNAETDVIFTLRTRRNPEMVQGQNVTWNNMDSIRNSNFDPSRPTMFTIHGWNGDGTASVNWRVNERYFRLADYNMIGVDWSLGSTTINYITARNRVGAVASVIARFIDNLHQNGLLRFEETHLIGHSLGGQIVGLTGKAVTRGRVQKIVALDPAGPLFSINSPNERVDSSDGEYVEVIHTNYHMLGFREPIGHADFYPNFGRVMPGCEDDITGQCSHSRSTMYYAESITDRFTATECVSFDEIANQQCTPTGRTNILGGPVAKIGLTGLFFLPTNAEAPFSQG